jgi:hypothetical protein
MPTNTQVAPANVHETMQSEVLKLIEDMAGWRSRILSMQDIQFEGRALFFPELPSSVRQIEMHLGSMDRLLRQTFQLPEAAE